MGPSARWEYMTTVHQRYRTAASRRDKGLILDEFCKTYRCHRKHALRLLNAEPPPKQRPARSKRGSPYRRGRLPGMIEQIWVASDHLCGQRLKPTIVEWLPDIRRQFRPTPQEERLLLGIAASTLDRMLAAKKMRLKRRIYGTTKPGTLLKHQIPIKTDCWDVDRPGFTEVDLVSHSGACAEGDFGHTLDMIDIMSGWVERRCVLGKAEIGVQRAIDDIRRELPFDLLGIDSDNGSEFINAHLYRYCKGDPPTGRASVQFTRSRPYKKDDNAHVEQKNWTHVRKLLGYGRYDREAAIGAINDLYRSELRWFQNIFQPSMRLQQKVRIGSRVRRKYDQAKTPLRRLIESGKGDAAKIDALLKLREQLNPFELSRVIGRKLRAICAMTTHVRATPTRRAKRWQMETYSTKVVESRGPRSAMPRLLGKLRQAHGKELLLARA
jgi:hypothetical protein